MPTVGNYTPRQYLYYFRVLQRPPKLCPLRHPNLTRQWNVALKDRLRDAVGSWTSPLLLPDCRHAVPPTFRLFEPPE